MADPKTEPLVTSTPPEITDPDLQPVDNVVKYAEGFLIAATAGLWALNGLYIVHPRETRLILHNGRLTHLESRPGLHWAPTFGRQDRIQATSDQSFNVPELKVVDSSGVPIIVSAVLVYRVVDAKKALLDIRDVQRYVQSQASAALKLIVSQYSFDALKVESTAVQQRVVDALQEKLMVTGVEAVSMTLNELNYAPEIASAMLKKQQAAALVSARELIVDGAVSICVDAVTKLEAAGMALQPEEKTRIVTNLLTVICGEENATPVISVGPS